jgi:predicted lipoprotein with Yx(FWY)xxD motif
MTTRTRISAVAAAILLVLTGCSGDDEPTTVAVSNVSGTGEVLVTTDGRALYTTEQDTGGKPACVTESCVAMWVPLTVAAGEDPTGPDAVSERLGTVDRPDGARQVTLDSKPLYTFTLDKEAGKVTGNGLSDTFDGTTFHWQVAGPGDAPATSEPDVPGY